MNQWQRFLRWWLATPAPLRQAASEATHEAQAEEEFSPGQAAGMLRHPARAHTANATTLHAAAQRLQRGLGNRGVQLLAEQPGDSLPTAVRNQMSGPLGDDLADVHIHHGPAGAELARLAAADAVTVGRDIAFAEGKFAPETPQGQQLLTHELAHTAQAGRGEAGDVAQLEAEAASGQRPTHGSAGLGQILRQPEAKPAPVQQAAKPNPLQGRSTRQTIDYRAEQAVQIALAQSSLWPYIGGKVERGTKIEGRVTYLDQKDFEAAYVAYAGRESSAIEKAQDVRGFYDPAKQQIILAKPATLESLLHETIHRFADRSFRQVFGAKLDEGVTQFFTNYVLQEYGLPAGRAYPKEAMAGSALASAVGLETLALGYFLGPAAGVLRTLIRSRAQFDAGAFARAIRAETVDWQAVVQMIQGP
jgi:hypothetical protein